MQGREHHGFVEIALALADQRLRRLRQFMQGHGTARQLPASRSQLKSSGGFLLLQVAARAQGPDQIVDGGGIDLELAGQLANAQPLLAGGRDGFQNIQSLVQCRRALHDNNFPAG